jgi:hypothetical protein
MFPECSPNVPQMFPECSPNVPFRRPGRKRRCLGAASFNSRGASCSRYSI